MRQIRSLLLLVFLFGAGYCLVAQNVVTGKYKGHLVKMKYYKGNPDDIEYLEYGLVTELKGKISELEREINALQKELKQLQQNNPTDQDTSELQNLILERDLLVKERQIDSLQNYVQTLNDSILLLQQAMQAKQVDKTNPDESSAGHSLGVCYRIGTPWVFGPMLAQTTGFGEAFWRRQLTLSHHAGIFWNSASVSKTAAITFGVGLEYSRIRISAGIGQLYDTIEQAVDADGDTYSARLAFNNVAEKADLHYISIPLTLSFGQPRNNRISGYGQISLVPSFLAAAKCSVSGTYNCSGLYSELSGLPVDFELEDFENLGFGNNCDINQRKQEKQASPNRFVLLGRLSGGFYLPLCNIKQGKTSQWVLKMGVNLDLTITAISHETPDEVFPEAKYHLDQYNLLSGTGCRFLNPGVEVGLLYIINKKSR